jgi:flagellar assembly protein FliH
VPPPPGSKAATSYTRFIPREELGDFAAWKPGSLSGQDAEEAPEPPPPPEPTADEWRAQIAAARQSGYQDGYRDGLVALEGFKQSFAAQATGQIGALLKSFDAELDRLDGELGAAVARTAVALARQVLRAELQGDPTLVARVAAEAVGGILLSARHITVQVHPHDLPLVAEGADEALQARGARLQANPAIARGGVLVESDAGSVDARIPTRWARAAAALGSNEPWEDEAPP